MTSSDDEQYGDPGTRLQILEATWELMKEQGAAIRLSEVATRAGVSRQAVYLHFKDRAGLILGLVRHMDETLGLGASLQHVFSAETGADALQRLIALHRTFNPSIDPIAQVLDAGQYDDHALGKAWRERLEFRRSHHRQIIQRICGDGKLPNEWSPETAGDLLFAITLPAVWRELIRNLGWTPEQAEQAMSLLVRRAFVDE
jgi:AcrR family transcriptional regulator